MKTKQGWVVLTDAHVIFFREPQTLASFTDFEPLENVQLIIINPAQCVAGFNNHVYMFKQCDTAHVEKIFTVLDLILSTRKI